MLVVEVLQKRMASDKDHISFGLHQNSKIQGANSKGCLLVKDVISEEGQRETTEYYVIQ